MISENFRRGEPSQRHKYRNRIAYLIATKRKSLKRLALKRVTRTPARRMKNKYVPRQTKRVATRAMGRKPYDKKMRRLSVQVSPSCHIFKQVVYKILFFFRANTRNQCHMNRQVIRKCHRR